MKNRRKNKCLTNWNKEDIQKYKKKNASNIAVIAFFSICLVTGVMMFCIALLDGKGFSYQTQQDYIWSSAKIWAISCIAIGFICMITTKTCDKNQQEDYNTIKNMSPQERAKACGRSDNTIKTEESK